MEPGRHFTDLLNEAESQELFLARWGAESTRCGRTMKGPTISLWEERKSSCTLTWLVQKNVLYPFIRRPAVYGTLGQLKVYDF